MQASILLFNIIKYVLYLALLMLRFFSACLQFITFISFLFDLYNLDCKNLKDKSISFQCGHSTMHYYCLTNRFMSWFPFRDKGKFRKEISKIVWLLKIYGYLGFVCFVFVF